MQSTKTVIQTLRNTTSSGQKLSIYLPTHPQSNDSSIREDATRLKNALQDAENHPKYDESELGNTIATMYKLLDNTEFWKHQDVALAIFGDSNGFVYVQLPYETTDACYISDTFVISPLVITQFIGGDFYVLDVNLDRPVLYRSSGGSLDAVAVPDMPHSFQDFIARYEYDKELQHQATLRSATTFHGHNIADSVENDKERYLKLIAKATDTNLRDDELPLILSGTENRVGNIRQFLTYNHVLEENVSGHADNFSTQSLYNFANSIASAYFLSRQQTLIEKLDSSAPEFVANGFDECEKAAHNGRIERLYVPVFRHTTDSVRPGYFSSIILQLPSDITELEHLIVSTIEQGGDVLATEIESPVDADIPRALCRY